MNEDEKKGVIDIVKTLLGKAETLFIIPIAMMLGSFYYFGFKINTLQDAVFIAGVVFFSVIAYFKLFTKSKEGDDNLSNTQKLEDIMSVLRLVESNIRTIEQSGIFKISNSYKNLRTLFEYRTHMLMFKVERAFLEAYIALGPFDETNNVKAEVHTSVINKFNAKLKLELDYYILDLNNFVSSDRALDEDTKNHLIEEVHKTYKILNELLQDLHHNEKINQLIMHTAILTNELTSILVVAIDSWKNLPIVV